MDKEIKSRLAFVNIRNHRGVSSLNDDLALTSFSPVNYSTPGSLKIFIFLTLTARKIITQFYNNVTKFIMIYRMNSQILHHYSQFLGNEVGQIGENPILKTS